MALSFTSIPDRHGAALYILYDGTEMSRRKWQHFAEHVEQQAKAQVAVISVKDHDGEKIRSFYGLSREGLPHLLVVRDSDEIAHHWSGSHAPAEADVIYALHQVGA